MHPEAAQRQPIPILKGLQRHRVNCVIVGSFGAIFQGVDLEYTDIDLCVEISTENIKSIAGALIELNAVGGMGDKIDDVGHSFILTTISSDPEFIFTLEHSWVFLTPYGKIDLVMKPARFPRGYEDLTEIGASGISYAHIDDIRRSKELAGRDKDLEALRKFPAPKVARVAQPLPPNTEQSLIARTTKGTKIPNSTSNKNSHAPKGKT